ncbi:MAG: hypothetical protein KGR26_16565 [Cyanobacteria bacterium REEB65]|nr:hypothetical protein [Cyanobacteria bacterium REEB65]
MRPVLFIACLALHFGNSVTTDAKPLRTLWPEPGGKTRRFPNSVSAVVALGYHRVGERGAPAKETIIECSQQLQPLSGAVAEGANRAIVMQISESPRSSGVVEKFDADDLASDETVQTIALA